MSNLKNLQTLQSLHYEEQQNAVERMKQGGDGFQSALADWKISRQRLAATNFLIYLEMHPTLSNEERVTAFMVALP